MRLAASQALMITLLLLLTAPARAESRAPEPIRAGDAIELVLPGKQLKRVRVEVRVDGTVDLGTYGALEVAGLDLPAARAALRERLAAYVRDPSSADLKRVESGRVVMISGMVKNPGLLRLQPGDDLWVALARAGGAREGADLSSVQLLHGGQRSTVDLRARLELGDGAIPALGPGDTVFVPAAAGRPNPQTGVVEFLSSEAAARKLFVIGEVRTPGLFEREASLNPIAALALAGGPTPKAELSAARLITIDGARRLDLVDALARGSAATVELPQEGALILFVPPREDGGHGRFGAHVNILGGVNKPGRYRVAGRLSLVDALALAGGPEGRANIRRVRLVRSRDAGTIVSEYDLRRFTRRGGVVARVVVEPGDTLYVDHRGPVTVDDFVRTLSNIAVLAAAVALLASL